MNTNDLTRPGARYHASQNSWDGYNPYGRQHLQMTGGPGTGWQGEKTWTGDDRRGLRRLRSLLRKYWNILSPTSHGGLTTARPPREWSMSAPFATTPSAESVRFVLMCSLWYTTSALSSNTGKVIMTQFRYPVTLTIVQFAFVAFYCLIIMSPAVRFTRLRAPTLTLIVRTTLPMGLFQVGGHMFSSMAISRIPVSTVHTIKALSPLFTVAAYALLFGVSYSPKTYFSLLPLTLGVMLACTFDMSASNGIGLLCAFASALVFVSSNIFFKKVMPSNDKAGAAVHGSAHKLDKLNLLFYSSSTAFVLMVPLWLYYDLPAFLAASEPSAPVAHPVHGHAAPHSVPYYFFLNGTVHFAQNLIAFIILASTSPVTYSIASLIKRVAVICIAIVWFSQRVHPVQAFGIGMTFVGLWMYNNAKGDVAQGEKKVRKVERAREGVLPSTRAELAEQGDAVDEDAPTPVVGETTGAGTSHTGTYGRGRRMSAAQAQGHNHSHPHPHTHAHPIPPPIVTNQPFGFGDAPPAAFGAGYGNGQAYHRGHHPNLHIKITPPSAVGASFVPPSYPSPPPSLDSPPATATGSPALPLAAAVPVH